MKSSPQENIPDLWTADLPYPPASGGHKYDRGHVVVLGGAKLTGAARLAAQAALRIGAGLCTVVADKDTVVIYKSDAPHVMVEPLADLSDFKTHLSDLRRNAVVIGPGAGLDAPEELKTAVLGALSTKKPTVLDADALTVFADAPAVLFAALHDKCVLTPHEGEFARLFGDEDNGRLERTRKASEKAGCIVLLKGAETVIARPEGTVVVNKHASSWLATAGAGDVLSGMIAGLMAQGVDPFQATCAAAWMHGEAACRFGPGLVAPDIIDQIPAILRDFA
ncbi:MAG: NAD(P)H-hydrate dehydratase [Rhodospirillales bacterium]|nr:NAD(P)H-hydrate dehydratase [Rhodospirillales bacterium]